jgi:hypothetical protein
MKLTKNLTPFGLTFSLSMLSTCFWIGSQAMAQRVVAPWGDTGYNWTGDYNGDGKADIASARPDGTLLIRRSTGRGFTVTARSISTPWGARQYSWAQDFNNDGKTDLVTARDTNVYMHLSDPTDPTDFRTVTVTTDARWGGVGYNWVGDYNGDGLLDIASALPDGTMMMRFFNGDGLDLETWSVSTPWGGSQYTWAKDFNGDGLTDLASALESNLYLHLSDGNSFKTTTINSPGWGDNGFNWAGDFNGDGTTDLASALPGGAMKMRLFDATGMKEETWAVSTAWGGNGYSWAEDFNGDGLTDLASAREGEIFLHLSDGTQFTSSTISTPNQWGDGSYFNWAADYNGDGKVDLLSLPPESTTPVMRLGTGTEFNVTDWAISGYLRPRR